MSYEFDFVSFVLFVASFYSASVITANASTVVAVTISATEQYSSG